MRRLALALGLLGTGACFTESEPMGQSCPPGTPGCACSSSDTCDPGLECRDPGVCVEPSCTPGTAGCFCEEGSCADGLVCNELGACTQPPSDTSDTGAMSGTGGGDSTTTSSTSSPTSTSTTASDGTTTDTTGTTGPALCGACLMSDDAQDLCYETAMCDESCVLTAQCVANCKAMGQPLEMCGNDCCDDSNKAVADFFLCMQTECPACTIPAACVGM